MAALNPYCKHTVTLTTVTMQPNEKEDIHTRQTHKIVTLPLRCAHQPNFLLQLYPHVAQQASRRSAVRLPIAPPRALLSET